MRKALVFAAALSGAAFVSQSAGAAAIYSDLGPGGMHACCSGQSVGGSNSAFGGIYIEAVEFTSPFYASVDQIDLALQNLAGSNTARVSVWTKNGSLPGVELASWTVSGFPPFASSSTALVTISGISGLGLYGGSHYFLAVSPVSISDDSANIWNGNTTGAVGKFAFDNGYGWHSYYNYIAGLPAFDIVGHYDPSVPEPGTIALVLGGLAGAIRLRRRRAAK